MLVTFLPEIIEQGQSKHCVDQTTMTAANTPHVKSAAAKWQTQSTLRALGARPLFSVGWVWVMSFLDILTFQGGFFFPGKLPKAPGPAGPASARTDGP